MGRTTPYRKMDKNVERQFWNDQAVKCRNALRGQEQPLVREEIMRELGLSNTDYEWRQLNHALKRSGSTLVMRMFEGWILRPYGDEGENIYFVMRSNQTRIEKVFEDIEVMAEQPNFDESDIVAHLAAKGYTAATLVKALRAYELNTEARAITGLLGDGGS